MPRRVIEIRRRITFGGKDSRNSESPTKDLPWLIAFHMPLALLYGASLWFLATALFRKTGGVVDALGSCIIIVVAAIFVMTLWMVLSRWFDKFTESHFLSHIKQCKKSVRCCKNGMDAAGSEADRMKLELSMKQWQSKQTEMEGRLESLRLFRAKVRRVFVRG